MLVRRSDNYRWAVPGGYMEAGESFSEACEREVLEETGLTVRVKSLIGIYTTPNLLLEYPDGNKWQLVILHFEAELVGGELIPSEETTDLGFFSPDEVNGLDVGNLDRKRIRDGFAKSSSSIIVDDFSL